MKFFQKEKKKTLTTFEEAQQEIERLEGRIEELAGETKVLRSALKKVVQTARIIRFNPFRESGGDQSFTISLLDEQANGVVITSHYGRDYNRVYAKPIKGGQSDYSLSEEEEQLIQEALQSKQKYGKEKQTSK